MTRNESAPTTQSEPGSACPVGAASAAMGRSRQPARNALTLHLVDTTTTLARWKHAKAKATKRERQAAAGVSQHRSRHCTSAKALPFTKPLQHQVRRRCSAINQPRRGEEPHQNERDGEAEPASKSRFTRARSSSGVAGAWRPCRPSGGGNRRHRRWRCCFCRMAHSGLDRWGRRCRPP